MPVVGIAAGLVFLLRFIVQGCVINRTAKHFKERRFCLSILFFDIVLPLITLYAMFGAKLRRKRRYQWK